jgi:hypothetical protein
LPNFLRVSPIGELLSLKRISTLGGETHRTSG